MTCGDTVSCIEQGEFRRHLLSQDILVTRWIQSDMPGKPNPEGFPDSMASQDLTQERVKKEANK